MASAMEVTRNSSTNSFLRQQESVEKELPPIPVARHVITDEDVGALQGAQLQPINLNKVVKLLVDQHSSMLYERHLSALKKVARCYCHGFVLKDLVAVFKILNVCADRIEDHPFYAEPMIAILEICSLPFMKEKSSDELTYKQIAVEAIAQLGYLMRVPHTELRTQICSTLISFYCEKPPAAQVQKLQASRLSFNQSVLEESDVSETLVKSLALIENDMEVKIQVLDVLQRLSRHSKLNCEKILNANGAYRLCSRLNDDDPSDQHMFRCVDILWNILQLTSPQLFTEQLNNITCVSQLRDAFVHHLTQGYSHFHRQLRNDLLTLVSLVITHVPDAPFVETGFVKELCLFATFQEVKSHHVMVRHLKLRQNHEDFELKKILINILVTLSSDSAVLPILTEGRLLLALFSYVKSNEKVMPPQDWTVAQFEEIQLLALSALCTLGPLLIEDYMLCQANTRLLLLLEWCVSADEFQGHGNSFHGTGGRGNKRAQMHHCLRLIRSMASTGNESLLTDLSDQGAINQITSVLRGWGGQRVEDAVDIEMQTDMLVILSTLCEHDTHRKELFGSQGVDVIVKYLKADMDSLTSGLGHHTLLLTAIDTVWCAVVGCYITEDNFLEKEGVFLLFDLLESCPKSMHNLILGCVLDLAQNPKTIAHINAWRGKENISAAHLLCEVWREEEREIGVPRSQEGTITDAARPLIGSLQESQGVTVLPPSCPSQAIVDVSENMRAKVYALFCKMGFIELPGLVMEDHVTLTIIEHYLDFKLGEVWGEIEQELIEENVRPVTPDREALEAIGRTVEERTEHVAQVQRELVEAQNQQDLIEEQEHYAEIRENHRQKEKTINSFGDFVARTSNYQLLKAAKERQELSIEASRVQTNYKTLDTFHGTDLPNLTSTTFGGRHVAVDSTPHHLTGGALANYDPSTGTIKPQAQPIAE